jgi:hypothetical protein
LETHNVLMALLEQTVASISPDGWWLCLVAGPRLLSFFRLQKGDTDSKPQEIEGASFAHGTSTQRRTSIAKVAVSEADVTHSVR